MRVLVNGLPPESATKAAIRDGMTAEQLAALPEPDGWGQWSSQDSLLAAVCDRLDWVVYAIYAAQGGKPEKPEPIRRPGVGPSAADRKALRHQQRLSAAHLAYVIEHDGASPPPDWVPDLSAFPD